MKIELAAENSWMLTADSRLLPLARLLHYAKCEALELGLADTAATIDQALAALVYLPDPITGGSGTTH